ncbi:MAG: putative LPS assembly protein LptD [Crocinitomicaceae bacterium]
MSDPVNYSARDSIVANAKNQIVKLYGEALVTYDNIELKADYIEIDIQRNEVLATYTLDSLGNPVGKPVFNAEGEESTCDYMKYNFKTKKGYIKEVRAQQDEGYIHMAESKIHPNEQIHLKNGKFTTCDLDTPHYHFKMTKAIIVPEERIVTGPVFMKIGKIPTPLAAPFAFFPQQKTRKHGLIFPTVGQASGLSGFGVKDLGYYFPLGDNWETQFTGSIYTTGQWALANSTNYYVKYKHRGNFGLRYERLKGYFYDTTVVNKYSINWRHSQDAKAHPSLRFSSDVTFKSDNNGKTSLDPLNDEYFTNQFNSTLKLDKRWKAGPLTGSSNITTSLKQNSISEMYNIDLPSFSFNVSQFSLGDFRKNKIGKKWYENVNVTYKLRSKNYISAPDSIFNAQDIGLAGNYATNGFEQTTTVKSQLKLFGSRITFTPNVNYREIWNFQSEEHFWNPADSTIDTTQVKGFRTGRSLSFNAGVSGVFYGYYKFKGDRKLRFRHQATPSVNFSFTPDFSNYQQVQSSEDSQYVYISPFRASQYKEGSYGSSGKMTFNLTNNLKMKVLDKNDTINGSSKSFNIIDAANISGGYDFLRDSFQLDPFALSLRTSKIFGVINFQASGSLNPYAYDNLNNGYTEYDTLGNLTKQYAWENGQGIGRISRADFIVSANFTSKTGRKKQKEIANQPSDNGNTVDLLNNPKTVNFDIPWQLNIGYNLNFTNVIKTDPSDDNYRIVQAIKFNGDFSINQNWKFVYALDMNLQQLMTKNQENPDRPYKDLITRWSLDIWRNLHCWEASLQLGQLGTWQQPWSLTNFTFLARVNIKASMLKDLKLEYDQPPFF